MGTKIKLRQKPISGNRQSLYLDYYPPIKNHGGELTRREFLNLYLKDEIEHELVKYRDSKNKEQRKIIPVLDKKGKPKKANLNFIEKQHNKEIFQIAQQILQKRILELNKPEIYTGYEKEQLKIKLMGEKSFIDYFISLADKRKTSNYDNWISTLKHLKIFSKGEIKFCELNEKYCADFREHLFSAYSNRSKKEKLSNNTVLSYFNKFKAALKQAFKDGYLQYDLNAKVDTVKPAETRINFLTIEELNSLVKTECEVPILKKAALFSALTGLRFSDIKKLTWSELEYIQGNGYFLKFQQEKTEGEEFLPISLQAYELLGKPKDPDEKVFDGLIYSAWLNSQLRIWLLSAGIKKKITFHCFRHTFATLQLSKKTDIYTVSKMLGHRDLKTTQRYAKVIDQTKRDASEKIILDL